MVTYVAYLRLRLRLGRVVVVAVGLLQQRHGLGLAVLPGELERGVKEGIDSPIMFRGAKDDAAARIQAAARGRTARLEWGDIIQTALVVKAAREQALAELYKDHTA